MTSKIVGILIHTTEIILLRKQNALVSIRMFRLLEMVLLTLCDVHWCPQLNRPICNLNLPV